MKKFLHFTGATVSPPKNSVNYSFLEHKKTFFYLTSDFLENFSTLVKNQTRWLCTLSGGQDSILTFFLLLHSSKKDYLQIVYCHHFWQIKNFFSTRFVFQISCLMKVPYTLILPQTFFRTENESRTWRKKIFCRISQREHFLTSVTGHTETDSLEKHLHNVLRGTSPAGLSDFNFLKSKNKVVFFFSNINLNTCFCSPCDKSKQISQELVFQQENLFTKSWYNFYPKLEILAAQSAKYSDRKHFKFSKTLKQSNESKHLSINPFNRKDIPHKRNPEVIFFSKIENFETDLLVKKFRENNYLYPNKNIFGFFDSKTYLVNFRINSTFKQKKSSSFSFSTESINLPIDLHKPLNKTTRFSVSKLVNLYNFPLIIDVTNFSSRFSRNKIRHQLIPFVRSSVHSNVEFLLTNFFKMIYEEHKDREQDVEQVYFILKCLKIKFVKKRIPSVDRKLPLEIPRISQPYSLQIVIKNISRTESRSFIQKLFFKYKNINLNSCQILKLEKF